MIKIKKINAQHFYSNLKKHALKYDGQLKVFGKNYYTTSGKGYYYHREKNRITIYYETGKKNKFGEISEDKSFLVCWHIKFLNSDWLISFLLVRVVFIFLLILITTLSVIFETIPQETIFLNFIFFLFWVFFSHFSQAINLLNILDEITNEEYNNTDNTGDGSVS